MVYHKAPHRAILLPTLVMQQCNIYSNRWCI